MLMKCFCYLGLADRPLLLYGHCDDHSQHRSAAFGRRLWYGADSGQRIVCIHVSHHGYSQLDVGEKRRAEGGDSKRFLWLRNKGYTGALSGEKDRTVFVKLFGIPALIILGIYIVLS